MKQLRWAFLALKYHKFKFFVALVFFSIFLFIAMFLNSLIYTETLGTKQLTERWEQVQKNVQSIRLEGLDTALSVNRPLIEFYHNLEVIFFWLFLIGSFTISAIFIYFRKKELHSFRYLGLSSWKIGLQSTLEYIYPLAISFITTLSIIFLFQSYFNNVVNQVNYETFLSNQPKEFDIRIFPKKQENSNQDENKMPDTDITNVFNNQSFFLAKNVKFSTFSQTGKQLLISFLSLSFVFLLCDFIVVSCYSFFAFRLHHKVRSDL